MDKYHQAISHAKTLLKKKSRDRSHDLEHHQDVWESCQTIIKAEKLSVNLSLLEVATFWHDVVVGELKWPSKLMVEETCQYLQPLLEKYAFSEKEASLVIETIKHHEFRDTPTTLEGLVLQDADKLDALSKKRWNRTLTEYRSGKMPRETFESYTKTFFKWVPIISATFHFEYSRRLADQLIADFWESAEWKLVADEVGRIREYEIARKKMSTVQTKILRFLIRLVNIFKTKILPTF